ncbi:MAG: hypothetical protein LBD06_01015 [Candidatus Accumulibacter sp.]|nr:hypothetical protein [Accumulibacter sp.]
MSLRRFAPSRGQKTEHVSEDSGLRGQKTDEFAALSRRPEDRKPSARGQRTEDSGQKTDELAALSRRPEDRKPSARVQRTAV